MRKSIARIHPEAIESLKRYKEDLRAGHLTAAEYWRGQAGAYFTANPREKLWKDIGTYKEFALLELIHKNKVFKYEGYRLFPYIVFFKGRTLKEVKSKIDDFIRKREKNPILSTLGTYILGGAGLALGFKGVNYGLEQAKKHWKKNPEKYQCVICRKTFPTLASMVLHLKKVHKIRPSLKNPASKQYPQSQIHQDPNLCHLHLRKKGPKIAECRMCGRLFKWTEYGWKPIDSVRNPAKPHTEVVVSELPKCNFCTKDARFDGKTRMGPWAYMCFAHYAQYGVGLGPGKGQRLILSKKNPPKEWHEKRLKELQSLTMGFTPEEAIYHEGKISSEESALDYYSKNPIPKHCTPKQFGSETFYYAGKTMFRDKLERAISDLKRLGVKCKHSIRSKSYSYMLWTSKPTAVHFEMM